jgi:hypothetical protein
MRTLAEMLSRRSGHQELIELALDDPASLAPLFASEAGSMERSSGLVNVALSFVPDDQLQFMADAAVDALQRGMGDDSLAAELVSMLALEAPDTLQPHLEALWRTDPWQERRAWRGAQSGDLDGLVALLDDPHDATRTSALRCLFESRIDEAWSVAALALRSGFADDQQAHWYPLEVAAELAGDTVRRLYRSGPRHVAFPEGFISHRFACWNKSWMTRPLVHPTWRSSWPVVAEAQFGGLSGQPCKRCGEPLHRLLRFDEPLNSAPAPLEVVTCPRCLVWPNQVLFFSHDGGAVRSAGPPLDEPNYELVADMMPEVPVQLVETPARWHLQDVGYANGGSDQSLHRVFGEPTWVQDPEFPTCPECRSTMPFLLQLNSFDTVDGLSFCWAGYGILYVFYCPTCALSATLYQST